MISGTHLTGEWLLDNNRNKRKLSHIVLSMVQETIASRDVSKTGLKLVGKLGFGPYSKAGILEQLLCLQEPERKKDLLQNEFRPRPRYVQIQDVITGESIVERK